jgi:hypothetical protein
VHALGSSQECWEAGLNLQESDISRSNHLNSSSVRCCFTTEQGWLVKAHAEHSGTAYMTAVHPHTWFLGRMILPVL